MTLIKIDRDSIKPNPTAGITTYHFPVKQTVFEQRVEQESPNKWVLKVFEDGHLVAFEEITNGSPPSNWVNKLTINTPTQVEYSIYSEPDFFYTYIPTDIKCSHCGWEGKHTELKDNDDELYNIEEDEFYYHSDNVCPECGACDGCDLEFEKFTPDMYQPDTTKLLTTEVTDDIKMSKV